MFSKNPARNTKTPHTKQRKPTKRKLLVIQPIKPQKYFSRLGKWAWAFFASGSVVIAYLFFYPKLDIGIGQTLNSYDPFKTPIYVKNSGFLPINNFRFIFHTHELQTRRISINNLSVARFYLFDIPKISPGQTHTVFLDKTIALNAPIEILDIYVEINYQTYAIPYNFTEWRRFSTRMANSGEYLWYEFPPEDSVMEFYEKENK